MNTSAIEMTPIGFCIRCQQSVVCPCHNQLSFIVIDDKEALSSGFYIYILISTLLKNEKKIFQIQCVELWHLVTSPTVKVPQLHMTKVLSFILQLYTYVMCIYKRLLLIQCTDIFICYKLLHIYLYNVLDSMHSPYKASNNVLSK